MSSSGSSATGEYCWRLGDDEALLPGAIERLQALVNGEDFDLAILSHASSRWVDEPTHFSSYREYVDHFAQVRPWTLIETTLMSLSVFRRHVWAGVANKERLISTRYMHTLTMAEGLLDSGRILVLPDALVAIRRHRAPFTANWINLEMPRLHLELLLRLERMTGSKALKRFCRARRRQVLGEFATGFFRLTRRYAGDSRRIARAVVWTIRRGEQQ